MTNKLLTIFAAGLSIAAFAGGGSRGATEAWVAAYVSNTTATASTVITNGSTVITAGGVTMQIEQSSEFAVRVREPSVQAVNAGLTNGYTLVWSESLGAYRNGDNRMFSTASNIVYTVNGVTYRTASEGGKTWLQRDGNHFCRLVATMLQPSQARAILGGE